MAVYTDVADSDLAAFLDAYDIGTLVSFKGIAEGVENSNFLLRTTRGGYFLTLYEKRVAEADLPFFLGLMRHLAAKDVPCPLPVEARDGAALRRLAGRPAAIVTLLDGVHVRRPETHHCAQVGAALADLHKAAADYSGARENALSLEGWRKLAAATRERADSVAPGLALEIAEALSVLADRWPVDLPRGVIHADLFPDNVLFLGARLSGLIDFYFSCVDFLAYDLAILMNAWCFESDGAFNVTKGRALLSAYHARRPLADAEVAALPILARGAALRFLLTRLYDFLNRVPDALVRTKDPLEYRAKMRFHAATTSASAFGLSP